MLFALSDALFKHFFPRLGVFNFSFEQFLFDKNRYYKNEGVLYAFLKRVGKVFQFFFNCNFFIQPYASFQSLRKIV